MHKAEYLARTRVQPQRVCVSRLKLRLRLRLRFAAPQEHLHAAESRARAAESSVAAEVSRRVATALSSRALWPADLREEVQVRAGADAWEYQRPPCHPSRMSRNNSVQPIQKPQSMWHRVRTGLHNLPQPHKGVSQVPLCLTVSLDNYKALDSRILSRITRFLCRVLGAGP